MWVVFLKKKEERHTAAPIDAQVATRHSNSQGQAALLVALFAALLAALLLVRLELGLHLVCAQQHMCQASANLKCRQKVWNHPGLARRRRLLLLLLALARVLGLGRGLGRGWLESGPFFKGHDLLEVENQ